MRSSPGIFSLVDAASVDRVESVPARLRAAPNNLAQRADTAMPSSHHHSAEVDELLLNARLRDELEPFLDESVHILDCRRLPTHAENEFLSQMLAWERAPVLPIGKWFEPELA